MPKPLWVISEKKNLIFKTMNKFEKRINQLNKIFDSEYHGDLIIWLNSAETRNRVIDLIAENAEYILEKIDKYEKLNAFHVP